MSNVEVTQIISKELKLFHTFFLFLKQELEKMLKNFYRSSWTCGSTSNLETIHLRKRFFRDDNLMEWFWFFTPTLQSGFLWAHSKSIGSAGLLVKGK